VKTQSSQSTGFSRRLTSLITAALLALGAGCAAPPPQISCGAGTVFNRGSNECVAAPDLNIIVDDFQLGEFEMSQVDVPEQLQVGTPQQRSFTIKNAGATDRPAVMIRYAIAPVTATIDELRTQLSNLTEDSQLHEAWLGQVIIRDLAVGEQRSIQYHLAVPSGTADGLYGFFFAVDEVPLVPTADGQFRLDYAAPGMDDAEGTSRLDDAALVYAPATVIVGSPSQPNLRVLFSSLDQNSFEIDPTERGVQQAFTASARMSAQALNITEPVTARFELKLPGHAVQVAGKDLGEAYFSSRGLDFAAAPDATTWAYDANRSFELLINTPDGLAPSVSYQEACRPGTPDPDAEETDAGEPPAAPDECAVIFNDDGRDAVYQLHLKAEDIRLLGLTRALPQQNPGLDANGEVMGTVRYQLSTTQSEYQNNLADNVADFPVVFMAPEVAAAATDSDSDNAGVASNSLTSPYPFIMRTDDASNGFGNDWFGANYRNSSIASVDKRHDVAVSNYRRALATIQGKVLKQTVNILSIDAHSDWSTLRAYDAWGARANVNVWGYTVLNVQFSPSWCKREGEVVYCPMFEAEPMAQPRAESTKSANNQAKPRKKTGRQVQWEKEFFFMAGPVPLTIEASAGISSGFTFSGKFLIDETGKSSGTPPFYGVEFAAGPYVALEANVFGGVSVGMARAGVEGNLSIVRMEFSPLIRPKVRLNYDADNRCFTHADFAIDYEGPFTLTGPSGSVGIVAYVGRKICAWKCWKIEAKVFDVTIARFSSASQTWYAWKETTAWRRQPGSPGMCTGATAPPSASWRSPTSCSGEYCNRSSSNGLWSPHSPNNVLAPYKTTYTTGSSGCATVKVSGTTEAFWDRVVLYDATGRVLNGVPGNTGWSGAIERELNVCSPSITVAMETDSSITRSGVTVSFIPSP
jgi:hypothetical protein